MALAALVNGGANGIDRVSLRSLLALLDASNEKHPASDAVQQLLPFAECLPVT